MPRDGVLLAPVPLVPGGVPTTPVEAFGLAGVTPCGFGARGESGRLPVGRRFAWLVFSLLPTAVLACELACG